MNVYVIPAAVVVEVTVVEGGYGSPRVGVDCIGVHAIVSVYSNVCDDGSSEGVVDTTVGTLANK